MKNISYKKNTIGYLDITFGPIWDYIPLTRNYAENFSYFFSIPPLQLTGRLDVF